MAGLKELDDAERNHREAGQPISAALTDDPERGRAAAEQIRTRAVSLATGEFDWEALRRDRDEGRP